VEAAVSHAEEKNGACDHHIVPPPAVRSVLPAVPAPIAENAGEVELRVAALEAELAAGVDRSLSPQLPGSQPTPVRPVPATALDAPGTTDATEKKSYGKDEDDYYPTEIHLPSKKRG
jgi:hypothetical protein